jgi:hypothetical protein
MASGAGRDHVQVDTEAYDYRWPILVGCPQHYVLLRGTVTLLSAEIPVV